MPFAVPELADIDAALAKPQIDNSIQESKDFYVAPNATLVSCYVKSEFDEYLRVSAMLKEENRLGGEETPAELARMLLQEAEHALWHALVARGHYDVAKALIGMSA